MGPFTARTGKPLRGGTVLTGRAGPYGRTLTGMGPATEKDDEEAYGKAGPVLMHGRTLTGLGPLRGGTVLTGTAGPYGRTLTKILTRSHGRDGPYGKGVLTGGSLYGDGSLHKQARRRGLREG